MIDKMTKYSFILLSGEQEEFLSKLQELGVVDITRSSKPIDGTSTDMLQRLTNLKKAREILGKLSFGDSKPVEIITDDPATETLQESERLAEINSDLDAARSDLADKLPWGEFDAKALKDIEKLGYRIRYYKVARKKFSDEWASKVALKVVSEDANNVYFVTVTSDGDEMVDLSPSKEIREPEYSVKEVKAKIEDLESKAEESKGRLLGLKKYGSDIDKEYKGNAANLDRYLAGEGSTKAVEDMVSVFEGFAPTEDSEALAKDFDAMDMVWYKDEATLEDNPPIKYKNNKFVRMFEVLTDMYGRPDYNEFDPTPYISIFFMLFFAFCMGDMGYGLILVIIGLLMKKSEGTKKLAPLIMTLGAATIVIGFIFHTFFSIDIANWSFIPEWMKKVMLPAKIPGTDYDWTMGLALIVGVVHICVAIIVKTIYTTKNNGFANSLGTWGWTLLIVGGVIVGALALMKVMDKTVTKWVIIVLGIVSAIGIFFLNDLHRNPLKNIGSGLWETYNTVTGLLGDVLSYLRLYALGLAGAMLGNAFNQLGLMALGDGHIGFNWLFFILIVVIGHVLNLAMAALGAFVHPLRLNFLEFFKNSGYDGKGRTYRPLKNE